MRARERERERREREEREKFLIFYGLAFILYCTFLKYKKPFLKSKFTHLNKS
jgi:hypothetical protein